MPLRLVNRSWTRGPTLKLSSSSEFSCILTGEKKSALSGMRLEDDATLTIIKLDYSRICRSVCSIKSMIYVLAGFAIDMAPKGF